MNILTFDIEDWYNCDFISEDFNWNKYEVRIYEGVDRILEELNKRNLKGSFFCLGWLAENHPDIIRKIYKEGHHIGCHSYQHELAFRFDRKAFKQDTENAKKLIEDVIGEQINAFRAPGFSITQNNIWALEVLIELGFAYDCSIFPAPHDYGGMPNYGTSEPAIINTKNGTIKEFPINFHSIMWKWKKIVFSGGGYFRFFPYRIIKKWANGTPYLMTYFHPRDFDMNQPMMKSLPLKRRIKSYIGINNAFGKFRQLLDDFDFINIEQADQLIDWEMAKTIYL
jgi:polysaccharide deacetylase family protein (PEP-CTERM system associated)